MLRRNSDAKDRLRVEDYSVMKHKVRNLRAKLRAVLTMETCSKLNKREKIVRKIQEGFNEKPEMLRRLWTHSRESPKKFFVSEKQNKNCMHVFSKLSPQEIQQINEDRIYYLGEENVSKFQEYLDYVNQKKKTGGAFNFINSSDRQNSKTELLSSSTNLLPVSPRFKHQTSEMFYPNRHRFSEDHDVRRTNTANMIDSRSTISKARNSGQNSDSKKVQFLGNRENFLKKKRLIDEEQNAQRIITKLNLKMKQEKAMNLFVSTQSSNWNAIRQKNEENQMKTRKILEDKQKKNVSFGSIVQLNEELRKIYIKKVKSSPKK